MTLEEMVNSDFRRTSPRTRPGSAGAVAGHGLGAGSAKTLGGDAEIISPCRTCA